MNTIEQLIDWGSEQCHKISDSPRLDAEILLTHCLNKPRSFCRTWPDKTISLEAIARFKSLITLRLKPTPIAYIVGFKEFWSRNFIVNSSTLIPRPETELLVEKALDFLNLNSDRKSILDLGTGSGCIAITLDLEYPQGAVTAADISKDALKIAEINQTKLVSNVSWVESSWFNKINHSPFDLIVSNPPYIPNQDRHLSQGDLPAEPITALASGDDGLKDIRLITEQSLNFLNDGGMLLIEHGYDQKESVRTLFKNNGFKHIQQYNDLGDQARLTSGIKG